MTRVGILGKLGAGTGVEDMYVLVVIWTIAPFDNYAVLYNSED
jgi:hypothetical protein